MRGWVEIWTRPGAAAFEPVIVDPPFQRASFTRTLSGVGAGELVLPADYDRLDEIILTDLATPANNVRTLVRVFFDDGTATPAIAYEFFADNLERLEGPDGLVLVSGPGVESVLSDARVEPYDWDGSNNFTSEFPDWIWGGTDILGTVALTDLEFIYDVFEVYSDATGGTFTLTLNGNATPALAYNVDPADIEDELQVTPGVDVYVEGAGQPSTTTQSVFYVSTDATGGTFTLTSGGDTTGNIAYNAAAATVETAIEALGSVTNVTVTGSGTGVSPWLITFVTPADGNLTGNGSNLTGATDGLTIDRPIGGPYRITVYSPDSGNTLTGNGAGLTGGSTGLVLNQVQTAGYDAGTINGWTVAQFADRTTTPQLFGTYDTPPLTVTTAGLPAGTTWGLVVHGASQFAGGQKVIQQVKPGGQYHARIAFRTSSAVDAFRWVIRDPASDGQNPPLYAFPSPGQGLTVPANTLVLWDIDNIVIPGGLSEIINRLAVVSVGNPANFTIYPELSYFREGQPPTTIGDIVIQLMEDADGTNHATREVWRNAGDTNTWLDYSSFTAALDSNGAAWTDSELSVIVKRGKPYGQMLVDLANLGGYEWEIVPDTGTPGNWLLNVYNADGIGTDRTALTTPQIFGEESVGGARLYRRHPPGSNVAVEGTGQISARASSAGALTAYGRRETYIPDLDITTLTDAGLKATQTISAYLRKSQPITLSRQPRYEDPFPLVAYQLGDTVNVSEPPFMAKDGRRLVQVVWALEADSETVTESFGAVSYVGQAAINQGVFQLLNEFKPIREPDKFQPVTAGGGGVIPFVVAAVDAPQQWKDIAGWICSGVDDDQIIDACYQAGNRNILLSPGNFYLNQSNGGFTGGSEATIMGNGANETVLQLSGSPTSTGQAVLDVYGASDFEIRDFTGTSAGVDLTGILVAATDGFVSRVVVAVSGTGVRVAADWVRVEGSYLYGGNQGLDLAEGLYLNGIVVGNVLAGGTYGVIVGHQYSTLADNHITSGTYGIYLAAAETLDNLIVTGNKIEFFTLNGVYLDMTGCGVNSTVVVTGNSFYVGSGASGGAATNSGVYVVGLGVNTPAIVISDNAFYDIRNASGILLDTVRGAVVADNRIHTFGRNGIVLDDSQDCIVRGNLIGWHSTVNRIQTNNTYDGIRLEGDSDRNLIEHNKIFGTSNANKLRYALNVSAAACDINVIVGNDLRPAGNFATGQYNDAGTGTVNAYPAGAAGDNFL